MSAAMAAAEHQIERAFAGDGDVRVHKVTFERNTRDGRWRASCSCFWVWVGPEDEVRTRAAGHDIEWVPVS